MQQKKSSTPWIVCGVIALVVVCGSVVLLVGGFGLLAYIGGSSGLAVQVAAPSSVASGDTFDLEVTLSNQGKQALTVDSIDLPESALANGELVNISPAPSTVSGTSYHFSLPIPPGQSRVVAFTLRARAPGALSGQLKVHAGSSSVNTDIAVTVKQAAVKVEPTRPPTSAPATPVPAGDNAGIPYKAVVQIIAMVDIDGKISPGWSGSGSIVSHDGLVLTNAHVVLSDRYYQVKYLVICLTGKPDEQPTPAYVAKVMQVDQTLDIAVIRAETDLDGNPLDRASLNLPTVQMGDDSALELGDPLTIIGYPSIGGSTITLTRGEVAGFTSEEGYGSRAFIKTSATISGGNSGGLGANAQGQIIGIPTQLGYGGSDQYVDCRVLADTNRDGVVDDKDSCVPTGGFINALRPLSLARPLIEAAARGEINIKEGVQGKQGSNPGKEGKKVLFEDNFSDPKSGWDDTSWEDGEVHYQDGEYQVTVKPQKWLVWSYHGQEQADVIMTVDTRVAHPTGTGDYGLMCRFSDNSTDQNPGLQNFYAFEFSEDGYFSIWKKVDGENTTLYDWEFSDAIPAKGSFTFDAACVGNHLLIGVNDSLLADVTDDSLAKGKFGFLAGTMDTGGLVIAFDNLKVQSPQ